MRIRISTNITWFKYIFGTLALIVLYDIFHSLVGHFAITLRIQIEFFVTLLLIASYYYFNERKNVEFDTEALYLLINKNETIIPLSQVSKVRLMLIKINNKATWKIYYMDNEGLKQNVRIIPNKHQPETFESFKTHIKEVNPEVKIIEEEYTID